jgi:hypothetical protein
MHKISCVALVRIFFVLSFFTWNIVVHAQEALISDALSIRSDYGYEIVGRFNDKVLLFRDKYDNFEVQAYDSQMHFAWNKELNDLARSGVQVLTVLGGKNDFSVVFKQRKRGHTYLRIHKYDPGANMIDSMTIKDYGENVFTPPILEVEKSEDRNCIMVYDVAQQGSMDLICFKLDKMALLWEKVLTTDPVVINNMKHDNAVIPWEKPGGFDADYFDNPISFSLGNKGDLFFATELSNRKGKIENHALTVLHVNASARQLTRIPMPDFLTTCMKYTVDNLNHQLVITGLYSDKNRERSKGVFFAALDYNHQYTFKLHAEPFDEKFVSILRQKDMVDDNKGIEDATIKQLILRQDGGVLLFAERFHEIQRGASAGRGFWRDGMRMVVDYYYDDTFVIAMEPDGKCQWKTVLHKKQYSQDDEGTFSSFFVLLNTDKLRILFNDEIKYENTCSEYLLSPLGDFDRNSLLNTMGQGLRMRFRDALQISPSECLVPSEFRNKLKLVLIRYNSL